MKKDRLISLIKNPQVISKEDNESLNHITHKYPFFSISHILLAKGLLNIESIQYNQKLKKAALYSTNRKNLFKSNSRSASVIFLTCAVPVFPAN